MNAVTGWLRIDLRRRWRSVLVLALLTALASGTVMTAVAGAMRGATTVDRLLDQTLPADVAVLPNQPGFDWDAVRALPEVETLTTFAVTGYWVDEVPPELASWVGWFPPTDDEVMRTIEVPVRLDGRIFDPERPDEVVVSPQFHGTFGLGVGDQLTLRLATPEQIDGIFTDNLFPETPDGPTVEATIVGVVRSGWFSDETADEPGIVIASPALYAEYAPNLVGSLGLASINALARLHGGETAVPAFKDGLARVSGREDIEVWNIADLARHSARVTGFEANSLLVFGLAAAIAAVFLVGQAIARFSASTVSDLATLRALGLTPRQSTLAAVAGPLLAGTAGAVIGAGGAVVASRWFPIGTAALFEPEPGFDADLSVLAIGVVAVPVLVAAGAWLAAVSATRSAERSPRRSVVAVAAARAGAPAAVSVGTRFALEPGRGAQAVPVRPALIGAVTGVLGVLAAFTFSHGVEDAAGNPLRFGQTYQLEAALGYNGTDFWPAEQVLTQLAADRDVVAINDTRTAVAQVAGVAAAVFTVDPVDAPIEHVVSSGRMPHAAGEIALAPRSAGAMGVQVGDVVTVVGAVGELTATVTGVAFVPAAPHNDYATGAWATTEAYDMLFGTEGPQSFKSHSALIGLDPEADPATVAARLVTTVGQPGFGFEPPLEPVELTELKQVRVLPVVLAGFLAVLALGAIGHALATAVRRRRHDVAVMRALGMTRRQSRGVIVTQASVLALAGLAAGIPLGIALGRTLWRYVAETTPVFYVPPVALLALVLAVPIAMLAANLLAAWPGHRAASLRVSDVLRAE